MADDWGPLALLAGDWEGESAGGLDTAFSHVQDKVLGTPYLERLSFKPFGPVVNGRQSLYGLDYRTAMWRGSEENPFHTEVGYWLWDPETHEIVRGFVVPRGITILAGGTAAPDAKQFSLAADPGDRNYNIGENKYLTANASTLSYRVTITINDDDTWSYDETTMLKMSEMDEPFAHTDRNTLHRKVG
ncbi:MAG TPA: heme-binding beta-barrel domain-containing protein [Acidimicrobiia bacterium]|nr:heme-binding beta-barrel domain-containing protein [Acidimicrobiia bacterium]